MRSRAVAPRAVNSGLCAHGVSNTRLASRPPLIRGDRMSTAERTGGDSNAEADVACPSIETIYRSHGGWLVDFLRRRFGRQEAEELAQETYVRALSAGAEIRHPRAFLARVALSAARDRARRRLARPVLVSASEGREAAFPAPQEQSLALKQAILALPPKLQTVFLLSRFGGLTYEQIALRCGISVKAVEARMSKALALCAAAVERPRR
jgi:RNA polymerase sigma factor (sigma-70 family)